MEGYPLIVHYRSITKANEFIVKSCMLQELLSFGAFAEQLHHDRWNESDFRLTQSKLQSTSDMARHSFDNAQLLFQLRLSALKVLMDVAIARLAST